MSRKQSAPEPAQKKTAGIKPAKAPAPKKKPVKPEPKVKKKPVPKPAIKKRPARKRPATREVAVKKPFDDMFADLSPDNPKHARVYRFVDEYCIDMNGTQAAIRAGYSANSADVTASRMLANAKVAELVAAKKKEIADRVGESQESALRRWVALADVDVNELVEHRRCCCRYCWGTDFVYQETPAEHRERLRRYEIENARAEEQKKDLPIWDDSIELGYLWNKDPNPDCPECCGEGIGQVFFKDTRKMSPEAKLAYAGAKFGKDGNEIRINSREKALDAISRHVGLYEKDDETKPGIPLDIETLDRIFGERIAAARARQRQVLIERGYIIDGELGSGDD